MLNGGRVLNEEGHAGGVRAGLRVWLIGYCAVVASLVVVGLLLTKVLDGSVGHWDTHVNRWLAGQRSDLVNSLTSGVTSALNTLPVIAIALVAVVVLVWRHQVRAAMVIVTALFLEITVFLSVTFVIARPRPDVVRLDSAPMTSSFPSGHTAAAVVLYGGIALAVTWATRRTWPRVLAWCVAIGAGFGAAFSRTYRGMHHPTDVAAGMVFGIACLWIATVAVRAYYAPAREVPEGGRTDARAPQQPDLAELAKSRGAA